MENKNIIEEFSKRKKRQIIVSIIAIALAFLVLLPLDLDYLSVFVIIGLLIFTWTNWKCPKCNKYFGKSGNPKCCLNCGVQLVEKNK